MCSCYIFFDFNRNSCNLCVGVPIYMHIYIKSEKERERARERETYVKKITGSLASSVCGGSFPILLSSYIFEYLSSIVIFIHVYIYIYIYRELLLSGPSEVGQYKTFGS